MNEAEKCDKGEGVEDNDIPASDDDDDSSREELREGKFYQIYYRLTN